MRGNTFYKSLVCGVVWIRHLYVICTFIFVTVFTLLNTTQSAHATVSCENFFSDTLVVNSEPLGQGTCSFGLQPPNFGQFLLLQRRTDALDDGINATATGLTTQIRDRTGIDYVPTAASCISGPCDIRPTLSSRVALLCNSLLNATCRFNVIYTPIFGTGSNFTAELEVNYPSGTISAVVNGQEFSSPPAPPEIEVVSLPNGTSITPTFGFLEVGSSTPNPRQFDVQNLGNLALNFTGAPRIEITGEHAGDFSILRDLPASLGGGQFDIPATSTSFELGFLPTATGTRNATVTIRNNDADEGVYTFNITGEGLIAGAPVVPAQMTLTVTPPVANAGVDRVLRYTITMPDPAQNAIDLAFEHSVSNDVDALNAGVTLDATSFPANPCGAGSSIALLSPNFIGLRGGNLTAGESCSFDIRLNVPNSALTADHTQLTSDLRTFSAGQLLSSAAAEFTYTVTDAQGPLFANLPADQILTANSGENTASLDVTTLGITATDNTDGPVTPVFMVGSSVLVGAYDFPIGDTTVTVDAVDTLGNAAIQETFKVTVKPPIELATLTLSVLPEVAAAGVPRTLRYTLSLRDIAQPVTAIGFEHDVAFVVGSVFIDTARLPANPCGIGSSATLTSPSFLVLRTARLNAGESCTFDIGLTVPVTTAQGVFSNLTSPIRSTVDAVERSGPQVTAPFTITADMDAPAINNVPATQSLMTSGISTANLNVTTLGVTVTDNVDAGLTPLFRIGSTILTGPFDFPIGDTTVTIDATDVAGNTATQASFRVRVDDVDAPIITASDIATTLNSVSLNATVTDNSGEVIAPEFAIADTSITSPHDFPLGVTTVDVSATDSAGNTGTAQFTVTVTDGEAPVISNLPTIATATVASGSTTAVATWEEPTASDNVGVVSFTSTANSGDAFPVGLNTVTYTARDAAGNETSESFDVIVNSANVLMVTGALVGGPIDVGATGTYRITVTNPNNMAAIDASIAAIVGSVTAPLIITGLGAGTPVVSGPCTGFMGTASPSFTGVAAQGGTVPANASCSVDIPITTTNATPAGEFPVFGVAVGDVNGVELTGAFFDLAKLVIVAPDTTAPVITVPANIVVSTDAGQPNAVVTFAVTASDDVDGDISGSVVLSQASGSTFPVGVTTVTADVMDSSNNAATQASFTVTVNDTEDPVIVGLPTDIDLNSATGTGLVVTWVEPTVTDNVSATLSASANSGDTFPIGVSTVTYTARDAAGNETVGSFTVTVRDTAAPTITPPADIVVSTDAGQATAVVTFAATATDSVDGDLSSSIVYSPASGTAFPVGVTTVTADVTDSDGIAALQESFTVTVNDTEAPVITVPTDVNLVAGVGATTAIATFAVTAIDAVDGDVSGSVVLSQASGTAFPIGTTVVTADVQDAVGNAAVQAQFNVIVRDAANPDTTPPVLTISGVPTETNTAFTATFDFDEDVMGFEVTDIDVTNGAASGFEIISARSHRALITPDTDGNVTLNVPANTLTDLAGNPMAADVQAQTEFDGTGPTAVISALAAPISGPFDATVTFSEDVTGLVANNFTVVNGVIGLAGTGQDYTISLTPSGPGDVSVILNADQIADRLGNLNTASNLASFSRETDAPVLTITGVPDTITTNAPFNIGFSFSEAVIGFSLVDVNISGGVLSGFSGSGSSYQGTITPNALSDVTIAVSDGVATDPAGNMLIGSSETTQFNSAARTSELIAGVLQRRANSLLSNQPNISGFLTGVGQQQGVFKLDVSNGVADVNIANRGDESVWFQIKGSRTEIGTPESDYLFGVIGSHRKISENTLIGAMLQFDHLNDNDGAAQTSSDGWMFGPYFATKHPKHPLFFDGSILYGQTDNRISPFGTYTDSFETERYLISGQVSGYMQYDNLKLTPRLGLQHTSDEQLAYTDTLGNLIPDQSIRLSELNIGMDWDYDVPIDFGQLHFTGGLSGIWSKTSGSGAAVTVVPEFEGFRSRLDLGIRYALGTQHKLDIDVYLDGIGQGGFSSHGISLLYALEF